jgi:hypothetical protein
LKDAQLKQDIEGGGGEKKKGLSEAILNKDSQLVLVLDHQTEE